MLVAAACGSDSSQDASQPEVTTDEAIDTEATDDTDTVDEAATDDDGDAADDDGSGAAGSGGDATLALANGETIEFDGVLCALEPQESAGSEILFTAVSYGDPGLDITQFGESRARSSPTVERRRSTPATSLR